MLLNKNILAIGIVFLFVCSAFIPMSLGAVALENDVEELEYETIDFNDTCDVYNDFTHTVFAEFGTATWDYYGKYAHCALKEIYTGGHYPFYYVSLLYDENVHGFKRLIYEYNIFGYPTVYFDGGYEVVAGAISIPVAKAAYEASINQGGIRVVEDININLDVIWLGSATMEIGVEVVNNEPDTYGGHIRVYVTEKESSMGWYDTAGDPYTFAFLQYAFNESISIPAGGTWSNSITWDGHNYDDGHGHNFGSITRNNIMVISAVFNDEWHQGYSYPPTSNPFDAYYVDETVAAEPIENYPPGAPTITGRLKGNPGKSYEYKFNAVDPDGDNVSYYIDWGDGTSTGWTRFYPSGVDCSCSHAWFKMLRYNLRAKAKDIHGNESDWGRMYIRIPRNKAFNFNFNLLELLFELFPNLFPILRHLLRL